MRSSVHSTCKIRNPFAGAVVVIHHGKDLHVSGFQVFSSHAVESARTRSKAFLACFTHNVLITQTMLS